MVEKTGGERIKGPMTFQALIVGFFRSTTFYAGVLTERYSIRYMGEAFKTDCQNADIQRLRFHDCRPSAIINMRRAGIEYLTLLRISGHKAMAWFTRLNRFRDSDLQAAAHLFHTIPQNSFSDPSGNWGKTRFKLLI
jgi:hypothetical protein